MQLHSLEARIVSFGNVPSDGTQIVVCEEDYNLVSTVRTIPDSDWKCYANFDRLDAITLFGSSDSVLRKRTV